MEVLVRRFKELSNEELYDILRVRNAVFIVEQECPYQDIDGVDPDAIHIMVYDGDELKAYSRVFEKSGERETAQIGRVLTMERGKGYGNVVLRESIVCAESILQKQKQYLEAQTYATGYYEKHGFSIVSDVFLEDGIPHVMMRRTSGSGQS